MCNTSAALGGNLASDSVPVAVSESFLLVPFPLPRRVFTNTAGLETSSTKDASVFSIFALSSSRTSFSCPWETPRQYFSMYTDINKKNPEKARFKTDILNETTSLTRVNLPAPPPPRPFPFHNAA